MNSGPLLFLGIFFTLASSFWGLVLMPELQIGRQSLRTIESTGQLYPVARPGQAQQGAQVYRSLGCVECHSQQVRQTGVEFEVRLTDVGTNKAAVIAALGKGWPAVSADDAASRVEKVPATLFQGLAAADAQRVAARLDDAGAKVETVLVPLGPDIQRGWGKRVSVAQDYLQDYPVQLGNLRIGPDLANIGARQTNTAWHLMHLYDPRLTVPGSPMPCYPFLFEKRKLKRGEARDPDALPEDSKTPDIQIAPRPEARVLTAYLLSLKVDAPLFEAPMPQPPPAPAEAASTNAPSASATTNTTPVPAK